ncbi:MAG: hypothetical protein R3F20_09930 [Planctomycetota bacterium]
MSEKSENVDWEGALGKPGQSCCLTGRVFGEGDEYVSALEATDEGLQRRDYDPDHFEEGRPEVFAFWRHRVAHDDEDKPRPLDINFLADFFRRLQANPGGDQREVAYIVSLLLIRKKILALEGNASDEAGEYMTVRFQKDEDAEPLRVDVPELTEEKMEAIRDDLGRIFNLGPKAS